MAITVSLPERDGEGIADINAAVAAGIVTIDEHVDTIVADGGEIDDAVAASVSDEVTASSAGPSGELYLAIQAGVAEIGERADESILRRPMFDALSARAGALPETVVIERQQTAYFEYAAYTPITADGTKWHRWLMSHRFGPGQNGPAQFCMCTLAYLYSSTAIALVSANISTGTLAVSPLATKVIADASDTGSWTASATVNTVTGISYPNSPGSGATRTYTVDNTGGTMGRLILRGLNNVTNGGIAKVVVKIGGVEISSDKYLCPLVGSERIANYKSNQNTSSDLCYIPIAEGVLTGTITVELSDSVTNPTGGRIYDGGLLCYAPTPYNTAGLHGIATTSSSANLMWHAGTRVVYQLTNCTRPSWKYRDSNSGGRVTFKVYDNSGSEISDYTITDLDTFTPYTPKEVSVEIASGLAIGTYWLHVTIANTKSTGSGDPALIKYSMLDLGAISADETTAGTPGVDTFDNGDLPANPSSFEQFGSNIITGPANMDFAIKARASNQTAGLEEFLTGTHGFETTPAAWTMYIDGVDRLSDYNALAIGGQIVGSKARVYYTTIVKTPTAGQPTAPTSSVTLAALPSIGTILYDHNFSAAGYRLKGTVTWTTSVVVYRDFGLMTDVRSRDTDSTGVGGGFDDFTFSTSSNRVLDTYDGYSATITTIASPDEIAFANDSWVVCTKLLNPIDVAEAFAGLTGTYVANENSYVTGANKAYRDIWPIGASGRTYVNGDTYTKEVLHRAFYGASMREQIAL